MNKPYVTAAVLAAGLGTRFSSEQSKQKISLLGKSIVRRAVEIFDSSALVDDIIVVVRREEESFVRCELSEINKPLTLVYGGDFRAQSAKNAFLALNSKAEFIAIHDAARCITDVEDVENVITDAFLNGAASASREVFDTVKVSDGDGFIKATVSRDSLRFVETPQVFSCELYKRALEECGALTASITDDNMLVEKIGAKVFLTKMKKENIKITTKQDFSYAEFILKGRLSDE